MSKRSASRPSVFEWDPTKAAANRSKHEVSFEEAETTFDDPAGLDAPDLVHSTAEPRMRHLGRSAAGAVLMVVYTSGRDHMAKKRSVSSARAARTAPSARRTGRWRKKIDYSEIPASTPEQLAAFRRIGRPPIGNEARRLIAIRLDAGVLAAYRKEAKRRGVGYQTLIHEVLAKHAARVA